MKGVVPNGAFSRRLSAAEAHKAQAIAARTYALRNRGQFMSQGYRPPADYTFPGLSWTGFGKLSFIASG